MSDSSQQKTENATPKRLRESRKRGQVARSRELSTAMVVGACVFCLIAIGQGLAGRALEMMRASLAFDPRLLDDPPRLIGSMFVRMADGFIAILPILLASAIAAIFAPVLLGGWNFSTQSLQPQWSRISPVAGLGRMFSKNALVELGKSLIKFIAIGAVGGGYIWSHRRTLMNLASMDIATGIGQAVSLALWAIVWMTGALLLVALIDAPYQWWKHHQELRMTRQEVRQEMKESEGKPEVKAKIRQLQQQMANARMMEKIPTADVVITNPTHYAVAIRYSAGKMRAPIVVAKGAGVIAATIRELASQHRVPLVSAPPLARALYRSVDLDREIPGDLYQAVAQVLSYLYQLRAGTLHGTPDFSTPVPGGEPDPVDPA